jgi:hypothetical protein
LLECLRVISSIIKISAIWCWNFEWVSFDSR